jgi:hypothetical protein
LCLIGEIIFAPRLENAGPMAGGLKIKRDSTMERTTRKQVENCFRLFVEEMFGAKVGFKPGEYNLDYISEYGGFVIEKNAENGCSHPFGSSRHGASEMWEMLSFGLEILRQVKGA